MYSGINYTAFAVTKSILSSLFLEVKVQYIASNLPEPKTNGHTVDPTEYEAFKVAGTKFCRMFQPPEFYSCTAVICMCALISGYGIVED